MAIAPAGPHRVRRPFDADGRRLIPGEIVDVTDWHNAYQLVDRGYLVAADPAEVEPVQLPATASEIVTEGVECPKCGAIGDDPCVSRTGRPTARHTARP